MIDCSFQYHSFLETCPFFPSFLVISITNQLLNWFLEHLVNCFSYLKFLWYCIQVLPIARELLQLVLRANLMLFYFEGYSYLSQVYILLQKSKEGPGEVWEFNNLIIVFLCRPLLSYIKTSSRHSLCVHWKTIKSKAQVWVFRSEMNHGNSLA